MKEAILDGEVVALDNEGRQNFRDLTAGRGNLHYAAFDALWIEGKDLRGLPLTRGREGGSCFKSGDPGLGLREALDSFGTLS